LRHLLHAVQADRRLEECAKLGITIVITPEKTETLTKAVTAALANTSTAERRNEARPRPNMPTAAA